MNPVQRIILLADDDLDDVEVFTEVLTEIDSSVLLHHAKDGVAVIDYFKKREEKIPDVIFMDINMPKMDGWACLSQLKEDVNTRQIPVIIYSTSSHQRDKQIAMELGASGFITKPTIYNHLKELMVAVVSNLGGDIEHVTKIYQQL